MDHIRRGERIDRFEAVRVKRDGTNFAVSVTVSPLKDDIGRVIGTSKVAREVERLCSYERG
jgi:hypothetical protein